MLDPLDVTGKNDFLTLGVWTLRKIFFLNFQLRWKIDKTSRIVFLLVAQQSKNYCPTHRDTVTLIESPDIRLQLLNQVNNSNIHRELPINYHLRSHLDS